ncbi:MAG: organomercurial lyase [Thermomicrobiales bacterium]
MANPRATEFLKRVTQDGGLLDYGPEHSRLLVRVIRTLARGRPVSNEEVDRIIAELGVAPSEADEFLRTWTERDADDRIVGAHGLSLNEFQHRFSVNGTQLSTWCAEDALFLPALLDQTATVESPSPISKQTVRLRVGPRGVEEVSPDGAVVSIVIVEPEAADMSSVEAIWGTFCHHIFFFASREEAEQWAANRDDIEILSVEEGYELGRLIASRLLAYEAERSNLHGGNA